jgi:hypothetical protein
MRVLRWTMVCTCGLLILLSAVTWNQGVNVVKYTDQQAVALHYMGHRIYYLEVGAVGEVRVQRVGCSGG